LSKRHIKVLQGPQRAIVSTPVVSLTWSDTCARITIFDQNTQNIVAQGISVFIRAYVPRFLEKLIDLADAWISASEMGYEKFVNLREAPLRIDPKG